MATEKYDRAYYEGLLFQRSPDSQRLRRHLRELLSYQSSGKLFELGCGRGEFLAIAKKHFDVQGIDLSEYAIQVAAARLKDRVRQGNIEKIGIPRERYDAIAAFNILEHLRKPGETIQKVYEGLRENGVLIGSVPLNFALLGSIHTLLTNIFDRTHVSTYHPGKWRSLFEQAGFQMVCFFGELNIGRDHNFYVREPLWPFLSFNLMFVCRK